MIYFIYHIESIKKIGCTNNILRRLINQQGLLKSDFVILYTTDNKKEASYIERYLQIKFKYKEDKNLYYNLKSNKMEKFYITNQTITLNETFNETLDGFKLPDSIVIENKIVNLEDEDLKWFKQNNFKSQINLQRYVYTNAFKAYIYSKQQTKIEFNEEKTIFEKIRIWAEEKGLYDKGDPKTQYIKLQEEAGELAKAILNQDQGEIVDAIGDIGVVLTNLSHLCGYSIEECLDSSYNVIKTREGKMKNGTFIKNK